MGFGWARFDFCSNTETAYARWGNSREWLVRWVVEQNGTGREETKTVAVRIPVQVFIFALSLSGLSVCTSLSKCRYRKIALLSRSVYIRPSCRLRAHAHGPSSKPLFFGKKHSTGILWRCCTSSVCTCRRSTVDRAQLGRLFWGQHSSSDDDGATCSVRALAVLARPLEHARAHRSAGNADATITGTSLDGMSAQARQPHQVVMI